jgi:hypothetical protein
LKNRVANHVDRGIGTLRNVVLTTVKVARRRLPVRFSWRVTVASEPLLRGRMQFGDVRIHPARHVDSDAFRSAFVIRVNVSG